MNEALERLAKNRTGDEPGFCKWCEVAFSVGHVPDCPTAVAREALASEPESDGERIEGWVTSESIKFGVRSIVFITGAGQPFDGDPSATLIIHAEEGDDD